LVSLNIALMRVAFRSLVDGDSPRVLPLRLLRGGGESRATLRACHLGGGTGGPEGGTVAGERVRSRADCGPRCRSSGARTERILAVLVRYARSLPCAREVEERCLGQHPLHSKV